jgi:DNA topoisomerase VI subunit A
VGLFHTQMTVDRAVDDLATHFGVSRFEMHVVGIDCNCILYQQN